jgi:hypothetical protein
MAFTTTVTFFEPYNPNEDRFRYELVWDEGLETETRYRGVYDQPIPPPGAERTAALQAIKDAAVADRDAKLARAAREAGFGSVINNFANS